MKLCSFDARSKDYASSLAENGQMRTSIRRLRVDQRGYPSKRGNTSELGGIICNLVGSMRLFFTVFS
jgi:hypothetical protein